MVSENVLGFVIKARDEASRVVDSVEGKVTGSSGRMRASIGVLGGAAGAAAGAGLAILGERTLALDSATAQFAGTTGATVEQAKALQDEVIGLSREHLQAQEDIFGTMEALVGIQGIEAENEEQLRELTEQYLNFATATGQDAATAVADFDDVLDSWGLTAADALAIQDKLVLSTQKFGTDIPAATGALSSMAPALKALNMDLDDGLGFINLFAASGLDASASTAAFNKAVGTLTDTSETGAAAQQAMAEQMGLSKEETEKFLALDPGQQFEFLAKQIGSMEDPAARAALAIELFGARGGVALANSLATSNGELGNFEVGLDESAGAAEEAASKIEGSFQNRLNLLKNDILGRTQDLTQSFGPALMGVGLLGPQVAGMIGGLGGALVGFGGVVTTVARTVGLALITPPVGVLVAVIAVLALVALAFKNNWFDIQGKTEAFADFVVNSVTGLKDGVVGAFSAVIDWVKTYWPEMLVLISGPFAPLVLLATDAFGIRSGLVGAFMAIKDKAREIFGGIPGVIKSAVNEAIGLVNALISAWNRLEFRAGGGSVLGVPVPEVSFGTPDLPLIPQLGVGGIVRARAGGTLVNVGEAGEDEAVVPLSRFDFPRGPGDGMTYNLTLNITRPLGSPREIAREVQKVLVQLGAQGKVNLNDYSL